MTVGGLKEPQATRMVGMRGAAAARLQVSLLVGKVYLQRTRVPYVIIPRMVRAYVTRMSRYRSAAGV